MDIETLRIKVEYVGRIPPSREVVEHQVNEEATAHLFALLRMRITAHRHFDALPVFGG